MRALFSEAPPNLMRDGAARIRGGLHEKGDADRECWVTDAHGEGDVVGEVVATTKVELEELGVEAVVTAVVGFEAQGESGLSED